VSPDGVRRYTGLQPHVVLLLRETVERFPDRPAVVELDGPSVPVTGSPSVVGVADPVMGEKVGAVVLPRPGVTAAELVPDLIAFARTQLADFKVPQFVRVLEAPLPRNAGGKVLTSPLRQATEWTTVPR
jgi:acyl-CoA synthetase (AMP-forming)/AMP-acid ligase II